MGHMQPAKSPLMRSSELGKQKPQRSSRPYFPVLADYFTDDAIIHQLCLWRVKTARKRNESLFLHRIKPREPEADGSPPLADVFPPRRAWHRHRPKQRDKMSSGDANLQALKNAIFMLRSAKPRAPWAIKLDKLIRSIRERALNTQPFVFDRPHVVPIEKEAGHPQHRPLAVFAPHDRIIASLTARYLRERVDRALDPASMAFRCRHGKTAAPRHHDAIRKILAYRKRQRRKCLYVAECDIRGFFDVVDHQLARESLDKVLERARLRLKTGPADPRALAIFSASLDGFTFPRNVLRWAGPELRRKRPDGVFKWPDESLARFHLAPHHAAIGVPQGGAFSALIANTLLDEADRALRKLRRECNFLYVRYCDDMVIVAPTKAACAKAFALYLKTLDRLKLPAHEPKVPGSYGVKHWDGKSRSVYRWGGNISKGEIPWVQFVGYHIRHDGMIRIRKDSYRKHVVRVVEAVDELLAHLRPAKGKGRKKARAGTRSVRKTAKQIAHRLRMRLISMAVGRPKLFNLKVEPQSQTWCGGFECLHRQPFLVRQLKALDRHRERQFQRLRRALATVNAPTEVSDKPKKALSFYGHPFSYFGQFKRVPLASEVGER